MTREDTRRYEKIREDSSLLNDTTPHQKGQGVLLGRAIDDRLKFKGLRLGEHSARTMKDMPVGQEHTQLEVS